MQFIYFLVLFVEEIFAAESVEIGQIGRPARYDLVWRHSCLELTDGFGIAKEQEEFFRIEFIGIEFFEAGRDLKTYTHGAHRLTIGDSHPNSATALTGVQAGDRNKRLILELHTREMAIVQCGSNCLAVDPRSAEFLERSFRAAAHGDAGVLQDFDSGIQHGAFERAQIRRRRNPSRAGTLEKIIAVPVFHGDDVKVAIDVIFRIEELRKLADGKSVAHRKRKICGETGFVGVEHRTFDNVAADRIGAIKYEKSNVPLGGFFHAVTHGCGVGVEAHAGVLHVKDEGIDAAEHFVGGTIVFAVEAKDGEAGGGIFGGGNFFVVAAGEAVLRAEERDELHAWGVGEQVDRAATLRIEAGVIGDQADVLVAQGREFLCFEDVQAGLHAAGAAGLSCVCASTGGKAQRRGEQRVNRDAERAGWPFRVMRKVRVLHG